MVDTPGVAVITAGVSRNWSQRSHRRACIAKAPDETKFHEHHNCKAASRQFTCESPSLSCNVTHGSWHNQIMPQNTAPVAEIGFSCQFDGIQGLNALDIAELYSIYRERFPLFQQVDRLPDIAVTPIPNMSINFEQVGHSAFMPRVWFLSADSVALVQFQSNRFSFNWRRIAPFGIPDDYPGYVAIRDEFFRLYDQVNNWAAHRWGVPLIPQAAELFYVNAIPLVVDNKARRISEVFSFYTPSVSRKVSGFNASWNEMISGLPGGYMQVGTALGQAPDGTPTAFLNLQARMNVSDPAIEPARWFDDAHALCLEAFAMYLHEQVK